MEAMSRRNALLGLRRHDWGHRWSTLLEMAGLPARPALTDRLQRLEALARDAEGQATNEDPRRHTPQAALGRDRG
jgi:hypothetical protein